MRAAIFLLLNSTLFGQSAFDVASVKPSQRVVGKDFGNLISIGPTSFNGKNVTLKRLIEEAYGLQPHQVSGALNWLDSSEYDVEAKVDTPVAREQIFLKLQSLLTDRFRLVFHHEAKELAVYELVQDKGGARIQRVKDPEAPVGRRQQDFRGDMRQFANRIALQLTIPVLNDAATPGVARGTPVPVLDRTGLTGIYDIAVDMKLELGVDMFTLWQRVLQGRLGLKLESRRANVDVLVVDRAERIPTAN